MMHKHRESVEIVGGYRVEYEVNNALDLSVDIPWMIVKMNGEEESNNMEQEIELITKHLKNLSFCEKMKRLFPNCLPLKKWMKDCTIINVDLLCQDPIPTRFDNDPILEYPKDWHYRSSNKRIIEELRMNML